MSGIMDLLLGVINKKQDLNTAMSKSIFGEEVLIYHLQKLTNKINIIQSMTQNTVM